LATVAFGVEEAGDRIGAPDNSKREEDRPKHSEQQAFASREEEMADRVVGNSSLHRGAWAAGEGKGCCRGGDASEERERLVVVWFVGMRSDYR